MLGTESFLRREANLFAFGGAEFFDGFGGGHEVAEDVAAVAVDAIHDGLGEDAKVGRDDWCAAEKRFGMDATERLDIRCRHEYRLCFAHQFAALLDTHDADVLAVAAKFALASQDKALAQFFADFLGNSPALTVDKPAHVEIVIIRLFGKRKLFGVVVVWDYRIVEIAVVVMIPAMHVVHMRIAFEDTVV